MKKSIRLVLAVLAIASFSPAVYADTAAPVSSSKPHHVRHDAKRDIQKAFDAWLAAVSTGSSVAVMKLYTPDAVLLPTLSPHVHNTPELRKEYFDEFTAKENLKGTVDEEHIRVFGDTAVNSGLYTFTYTKDGETVTVPARFSFVYRKTPQGWLIVDHHSSQLPAAD